MITGSMIAHAMLAATWPVFEVGHRSFELARPEFLLASLLLPPLLWLWGRRRQGVVVPSTAIWRRVSGAARRRRAFPWSLFIFAALLVAAGSRPALWPAFDPSLPVFRLVEDAQGISTLEYVLPSTTEPQSLIVRQDRAEGVRVTLYREPHPASSGPQGGSVRLPSSAVENHGTSPIHVQWGRKTYIPVAVPKPEPVAVHDRSECRAVGLALAALHESGLIVPTTAEGASVQMVRGTPRHDRRVRSVSIPGDGDGARLLPLPHVVDPRHPVLAGLDVERWVIEEGQPIPIDGQTLLADDMGNPLLVLGDGVAAFGFDPDRSDLPLGAEWVVLVGRLLRELAPSVEPPPSPQPYSGDWPRRAVVAIALCVALTWRALSWPLRLLVLGPTLLLLWLDPGLPIGAQRRSTTLDGRSIADAARDLPHGGEIVVGNSTVFPISRGQLSNALREREIGLVFPNDTAVLRVSPTAIELGDAVTVSTAAVPGAQLRAVAADGTHMEVGAPVTNETESHWELRPPIAGRVDLRLVDATLPSRVLGRGSLDVHDPVNVLRLAGTEEAGASNIVDGPPFRTSEFDAATDVSSQLPPAEGGIVVLDGLDPARLTADDARAIQRWVAEGGTLLAASAPPFFESSPAKTAWNEWLPAPLPPPPRREEASLGILLLDVSGSLRRGRALEHVVHGARTLLAGTPPEGRWGIATFAAEPRWIAQPGSAVDADLLSKISDIQFGSGTRLDLGLHFALNAFRSKERSRTLVLITDGRAADANWADIGRRLGAAGVELIALAVGAEIHESLFDTLARTSGGTWIRCESSSDIASILSEQVLAPQRTWIDVTPQPGHGSLDPLLRGVSRSLPTPQRRIRAASPRSNAAIRPLIVDGAGTPLLIAAHVGDGQVIQWLAGWDRDSLPPRGAPRLLDALRTVLVNASRGEPRLGRTVVQASFAGQSGHLLERLEGEPPRSTLDSELAFAVDPHFYWRPDTAHNPSARERSSSRPRPILDARKFLGTLTHDHREGVAPLGALHLDLIWIALAFVVGFFGTRIRRAAAPSIET